MKKYLYVTFAAILIASRAYGGGGMLMQIGGGVAAGGAAGPDYSDDFSSDTITGGDWVEESATGMNITGGILQADAANQSIFLRYDAFTSFGANQYGCFDISNDGSVQYDYGGAVFRWTDEGARYYLIHGYSEGYLLWTYATGDAEEGFVEQDNSSGTLATTEGDVVCWTLQGTGTGITLSVWPNPTRNYPENANNWDSASDPADWTSSNPANQIDSGVNMGLYIYDQTAVDFQLDNWVGGDF